MRAHGQPNTAQHRRSGGFSLEEVCISLGIALGTVLVVIACYRLSLYRAEWSLNSTAAQALARQRLEQTRGARWEPNSPTAVDELVVANFPEVVRSLDIPAVGTNLNPARVITTITWISSDPPMKWVQVDCVWTLGVRGPFTNRVAALRTADQ
jgi:hypothetical protein